MNLIFESKSGRTIEREEILTRKDLDFNLLDYWWRRREKQRNNFNGKRRQRRKKKLIELTVKVKQSGKRRGGGRKERIWKNKQTVKQEKVRKFINMKRYVLKWRRRSGRLAYTRGKTRILIISARSTIEGKGSWNVFFYCHQSSVITRHFSCSVARVSLR